MYVYNIPIYLLCMIKVRLSGVAVDCGQFITLGKLIGLLSFTGGLNCFLNGVCVVSPFKFNKPLFPFLSILFFKTPKKQGKSSLAL